MALGALAFGLARSSIDHRQAVLALVSPVTAGQPLTSADLGVADISTSPGVAMVPASQESSILGRTAATNLVAGALLAPSELGSPTTVKSGDGIVAVDLHQGSVASSMQPGGKVIVVNTAAAGGSGGKVLGQATVLSVAAPDATGDVSVSLVAPVAAAPSIAAASAAGNVALVVLPPS